MKKMGPRAYGIIVAAFFTVSIAYSVRYGCCCGRCVSEIPGRERYWFVDCFHGDRIGSFTDCLWLDNRCEQFVCTLFFAGFFNCTAFGAASCSTKAVEERRTNDLEETNPEDGQDLLAESSCGGLYDREDPPQN